MRPSRRPLSPLFVIPALALVLPTQRAAAAPDLTKAQGARAPSTPGLASGIEPGRVEAGDAPQDSTTVDAVQSREDRLGDHKGRRWTIFGGLETHAAFVQTEPNDGRARPDKLYNYYFLDPQFAITPYDHVRADFGMFEHFSADPGETGLRLSDFSATYTRYVPLFTETLDEPSITPAKGVLLRVAVSATAPTSFSSQLHGIITAPRLRLYAEKAFLSHSLVLGASAFGEYYIDRYRTAEGGAPNRLARYAAYATADYYFPFLKQLSAGLLVNSSWSYYYGAAPVTPLPYGNVGDAEFTQQPVQQIYSAEADIRYSLPAVSGVRASISLAYSVGDNSVLHDGVQHLYFGFYRRTSELYATLTARY